jgi:hypothetical protein
LSWIGAQNRRRYRTFFDVWPNKIAEYSVPSTIDIRTLPGYAEARDSASLFVTEAELNPDTGYPIISARMPIYREGTFLGCASVNITFDILSQFLAAQRPSPNSVTIIADAISGAIIASSDKSKGVRVVDGKLQIARLENIEDVDVREAYRLAVQTNRDEIVFNTRRGRLKDRNLRNDPRASLLVEDGYRFVRVDGVVWAIEDEATAQADIRRLALRYDGEDAAERQMREVFSRQRRVSYRLRVVRVYSGGL